MKTLLVVTAVLDAATASSTFGVVIILSKDAFQRRTNPREDHEEELGCDDGTDVGSGFSAF